MKEIEVKVRLKDEKGLVGKLKKLKAKFNGKITQKDCILDFEDRRLKGRDELVRVREVVAGKNKRVLVTFKGKKERKGKLKVREEIEFEAKIAKKEVLERMEVMGLKVFLGYEKKTKLYGLGKARISIDSFPKIRGMGKYYEIEADSEREVRESMKKLGVEEKDIERKNYVQLVSELRR